MPWIPPGSGPGSPVAGASMPCFDARPGRTATLDLGVALTPSMARSVLCIPWLRDRCRRTPGAGRASSASSGRSTCTRSSGVPQARACRPAAMARPSSTQRAASMRKARSAAASSDCGTPELQVAFHGHYEPRDHDRRDMAAPWPGAFGLTHPAGRTPTEAARAAVARVDRRAARAVDHVPALVRRCSSRSSSARA